MHRQLKTAVLCFLFLMLAGYAQGEEGSSAADSARSWNISRSLPDAASHTLGGIQFWSDHLVFHEWRIQQNAITKHFRLLDEEDVRRAWGTFEHCRARLQELKRQQDLPPLSEKAVVLLHGLGRSRNSMEGLAEYLAATSDFTVLTVSYASTTDGVKSHTDALTRVIEHLPGVQEINFVAHSMGNLIIRHYLARQQAEGAAERVHRIVMLAPPNQGARLAERFSEHRLFEWLAGPSGQEIAHWEKLASQLATPRCQFGIIAGGSGTERGYNPLIEGDNDLVVAVSETKLPGARDFLVVPVVHTTIMDDPQVREATLRFLRYGHFRSEAHRQPVIGCADES